MKGFLAIIIVALLVAGGVSSYEKYKDQRQEEMSRLYNLGYENGYLQGTYNPVQEIRSQIHNEGYGYGLFSGTGQPIWIERNGWDKNDSLSRFNDVDKIIVLAEISSWEICMAQEKKTCRADNVSYYKIITKHYTGWGIEGWDSPELIYDWERIPFDNE